MHVGIGHDGKPAEIVQMPQAELHVVPEGSSVHALEILDHFEHAHLAVTLDEGFELLGDGVELFRCPRAP